MKYIRFGEIPANEKSGIYKGEEKIGEELGVSVYSAIHDKSGNLCICIAFPFTRDTLDTFRMLTEYEDRPCYLVEGDFVGRDKDNQPLIRNVKKIARITTKEAKSPYITATTSSGIIDITKDDFLEKNVELDGSKVMKAPERLYLSKTIYSTYLYQVPDPDDETAVEYTNTDAFIEKAVVWISNNCYIPHSTLESFRKYMEGE